MSTLHLKEAEPSRESSDYAILPLRVYSQMCQDHIFFISHHWHDEIEMIYIEEGEFMIHINWVEYLAKAGDIYFINAQDIHQITALTKQSSHHAILFNPKIIRFEWHDPAGQTYINPLIKGKLKFPVHISHQVELNHIIVNELEGTLDAYRLSKPGWPILTKASLLKIIAWLVDADCMISEGLTVEKDNEKAMIAKTIMTHIQENYMRKMTIDELAELVKLSTSYFSKVFKSIFEKTTVEYINEYRIEKACLLLTQTDDKIIDIAFSVGFDNFSYFIRKFKALKGITPSTYRHNHRNSN